MNAMDAMADLPAGPRRRITIDSTAEAGQVAISVRDSGPGLPADLIATVFDPFVTTKAGGLGIGLSIARRIVAAHGGTIEAFNAQDSGAVFRFALPSA